MGGQSVRILSLPHPTTQTPHLCKTVVFAVDLSLTWKKLDDQLAPDPQAIVPPPLTMVPCTGVLCRYLPPGQNPPTRSWEEDLANKQEQQLEGGEALNFYEVMSSQDIS